ncbi:hypothetical protein TrCOL_g13479 [Triparma columacea]|uniref:Receptor ligand binding region domain-containing protein n=1 Tax=Triparma columacea TaxID=722753 RepID=A0A9W7LC58_9STRA|nr:hypothetical protein TrCOL_g13479 [Triparma columacea]
MDSTLPSTLTLGGIFPSSGGWEVGPSVFPAFQMAIEEINENDALLPGTELKYYLNDSSCDEVVGQSKVMWQNTYPRSIDMILGDGCSVACEAEARLAQIWKMPQISWGCTSPSLSNKEKFPFFLRTVSPDTITAAAFSSYIHELTPWRKVAWISEDALLFTMTHDSFRAAQVGLDDPIEIVAHEVFVAGDGVATDLELRMKAIKDTGVRIFVINCYTGNARRLFKIAKKLGMTNEGYQIFVGGGVAECVLANPACPIDGIIEETDEELKEAVHGALFTYMPFAPKGEPRYEDFLNKMVSRLGLSGPSLVNAYAVAAYEAVYSYAHAAHSFSGNIRSDQSEFMSHLRTSSCPGVLSNVTYDEFGDRMSTVAVANFDYGLNEDSNGLWLTTHSFNANEGIVSVGSYQTVYTGGTTNQPPVASATIIDVAGNASVGLPFILSIVAAAIFVITIVVIYFRRNEQKLGLERKADHMRMNSMRLENEKLHENLKMLQQYSKEEIDMIEGQIVSFRASFSKKNANDAEVGTVNARRDMAKLLIPASELESEELLGKGSFGEVHKSKYR